MNNALLIMLIIGTVCTSTLQAMDASRESVNPKLSVSLVKKFDEFSQTWRTYEELRHKVEGKIEEEINKLLFEEVGLSFVIYNPVTKQYGIRAYVDSTRISYSAEELKKEIRTHPNAWEWVIESLMEEVGPWQERIKEFEKTLEEDLEGRCVAKRRKRAEV